ncbi:MAG: T9SS type A sorting domain-containing protein [Saprospiraceae bacterium]|nr:T9SS type A sorting domain-containing protein [Saprospiraceae bacterium]
MLFRNALAICGLAFCLSAQAQQVTSAHGGVGTTPTMSISWTIGEPVTGTSYTGNGILTAGYQQPNVIQVQPIVEEPEQEQAWARVFPNPVKEELFVSLSESLIHEKMSIQLFNANGQPIQATNTIHQQQLRLDLGQLPAGTYLLQLVTKAKKQTYSIVKP